MKKLRRCGMCGVLTPEELMSYTDFKENDYSLTNKFRGKRIYVCNKCLVKKEINLNPKYF